jgi:condensin complex subunit 1
MSYCRLRDPASEVRRGTISVLKNLIMNDMVKVKGQISEMALCIVDTEEKLAGESMLHNITQ